MSLGQLMIAARSQITTDLLLSKGEVEVMPGPEPPPACGKRFISLYGTSWAPGPDGSDWNQGVLEEYGMGCGVTLRKSAIPYDRAGENIYISASLSLEDICRQIVASIHQSVAIYTVANAAMSGTDKVVEYFRWEGTDPNPRIVDADWFSSPSSSEEVGYFMEVRFAGASRPQTLANIV